MGINIAPVGPAPAIPSVGIASSGSTVATPTPVAYEPQGYAYSLWPTVPIVAQVGPQPSAMPTMAKAGSKLPTWAIVAAVGVGGVVLLKLLR